jgi:heme/copper-type cytochrome/quinol oxidase subunit 1
VSLFQLDLDVRRTEANTLVSLLSFPILAAALALPSHPRYIGVPLLQHPNFNRRRLRQCKSSLLGDL